MVNRDMFFFCSSCKNKSDEELERIECSVDFSLKHYSRGEHIAYQNDRVQYFYLLKTGRVRTEIVSDSGIVLPMEEMSAPFPLAVAFLFADNNRFPVDVIALEECEVMLIGKESLEKQMAACPGFLRGFLAFTANHMQYLSQRLKIFAHRGIKAKVVYYIMSIEKHGEFDIGRSVTSLAGYLGVERPSLSRAISEMVDEGVITFSSGKGKILNYKALQELLG